ncbi:MAG: peptide ABC transporter substrate-binding protein [Chlamydiales bacterium]|nr:peptide ABC transporter substrate-binding protein [Chlamydiales bacterium]
MRSFLHQFVSALLATALFTSCGRGQSTPEERHRHQELVINVISEPPTLDPGLASDSTSSLIITMVFEGLLMIAGEDKPRPAIAESYEVSEDRRTYTFKLRKSLWSNGMPLTAHDFEFAWKRALNPSFPGDFVYHMYVIKGAQDAKEGKAPVSDVAVQAIDDYTLKVELENPTPFFTELLVLPTFLPLCKAVVEKDPNWALEAGPNYVCNGPFKLASWTHNNQIVVEKNPDYWDANKVKLNNITILMVEDANTELSLFEDGEVDWAGKPVSIGLPTDSLPALKASGRLESRSIAATYFFLLNTKKPPFNNEKMRRAFAIALDRKDIVTNITGGDEIPATCVIPPPLRLQNQECFTDGDVKEARKLFQEALKEMKTTKEKLPTIVLSYNTSEGHHKIAQAVQQQWNAAFGVNVTLENQEWKVYLDKMKQADFMVGRMSWLASYNDAYTFLDLFKYADSPINYVGWQNAEYTMLLEQSLVAKDPKERLKLLQRAEKILIDSMPVIPVYFLTNTFLVDPHLQNYYMSPIGEVDFRYAYFED